MNEDTTERDEELETLLTRAYKAYRKCERVLNNRKPPNEVCGCGSQKKSKKCCGNLVLKDRSAKFMSFVPILFDGRERKINVFPLSMAIRELI